MSPPANHPVNPVNPVEKELRQDEQDLQGISELTREVSGCVLFGELTTTAAEAQAEEALA